MTETQKEPKAQADVLDQARLRPHMFCLTGPDFKSFGS
jgi:hypothetical protein